MSHTPAMDAFKAFRIHSEGGKIAARFEKLTLDDLDPGEVVIRVTHSDINYKDALAATGAGKILRRYARRRDRPRGSRRELEGCALPAGRSGTRDRLRAL